MTASPHGPQAARDRLEQEVGSPDLLSNLCSVTCSAFEP